MATTYLGTVGLIVGLVVISQSPPAGGPEHSGGLPFSFLHFSCLPSSSLNPACLSLTALSCLPACLPDNVHMMLSSRQWLSQECCFVIYEVAAMNKVLGACCFQLTKGIVHITALDIVEELIEEVM